MTNYVSMFAILISLESKITVKKYSYQVVVLDMKMPDIGIMETTIQSVHFIYENENECEKK